MLRGILIIISINVILAGCATSDETIAFRNTSSDTGIFESDPNGEPHTVLGDSSIVYFLKTKASIPANEFISLVIDDKYCSKGICVNFQLSEKGTSEYAELTKRNYKKKLFYVIDGAIITAPDILGVIKSGMGQFPIDKRYFDTLFVLK